MRSARRSLSDVHIARLVQFGVNEKMRCERFAWNTRIIRNAANPIDSPELGVIRKGVDGVNSFSHWPIITDSRHYPKLAVSASSTCSRK